MDAHRVRTRTTGRGGIIVDGIGDRRDYQDHGDDCRGNGPGAPSTFCRTISVGVAVAHVALRCSASSTQRATTTAVPARLLSASSGQHRLGFLTPHLLRGTFIVLL